MSILYFKVLHIVGFTSWFAGLFYLVRMFVYHTEAYDEHEPKKSILSERYGLMEDRVYKIICTPAMYITWISGFVMIYLYGLEWFKDNTWLHVKIPLVVLLTGYHFYCKKLIVQLKNQKSSFTSFQFRLFNEVPALFLIAIVIFAVFKNITNGFYAFMAIILIGILFVIFAKMYKRIRDKDELD